MDQLKKIANTLEKFAVNRDWNQFHSPKNLAMALSVEVAELVEEFQWLIEEQSKKLSPEKLAKVKDEIGDVFNYLVRICTKLDIDLISVANMILRVGPAQHVVTP